MQTMRWKAASRNRPKLLIAIVDQYEEAVAQRTDISSQFIEALSLLDRGELRDVSTLFVWLTTSQDFQRELVTATTRNARILVASDFDLRGPPEGGPGIVEETFEFHNGGRSLADYEILEEDVANVAETADTLGTTIQHIGTRAGSYHGIQLQDISAYRVLMLWPVTDGLRITRVSGFTHPRDGYTLDWGAWFRQLARPDQAAPSLSALNQARLYFDVRLIPIAAADLHPLARDLVDRHVTLHPSYLGRFKRSHFFSILTDQWNSDAYGPMRERSPLAHAKPANGMRPPHPTL